MVFSKRTFPSIEYHGSHEGTQSCLDAVARLLAAHVKVRQATLLTCDWQHAFFLDIADSHPVVIRGGFASGYSGQGPTGLAIAISMLGEFRIELEETLVSQSLFDRANQGGLTWTDVQAIQHGKAIRPKRTYDYVHGHLSRASETREVLSQFPPAIPWFALDERLFDIAVMMIDDPDKAVFEAFRRLESGVVRRCDFPIGTAGVEVFKRAFRGAGAKLTWPGTSAGEAEGRAQLFESAFLAYRNPRAHRDEPRGLIRAYREFYLLNELFLLEREACLAC